jgi:hypothetical protein
MKHNRNLMTHLNGAAFVILMTIITHSASAGVIFGPVKSQSGESIRLVTHSASVGGTIERTIAGKTSKGSISVVRDRDLVWTFRETAADGTRRGIVRVDKTTTATKISIDGAEDESTDASPLTAKIFALSKPNNGDWAFEIDGSQLLPKMEKEIEELKVYLKRDWYPAREVSVGDSWEFDPLWIKMIVEKDLKNAKTIGTMRLSQIRSNQQGNFALIDINIHSSGGDFKSDGSNASATVELKGQVTIDLKTMLDKSLELKGTITTSASNADSSTTVTLPLSLTAAKSFVR